MKAKFSLVFALLLLFLMFIFNISFNNYERIKPFVDVYSLKNKKETVNTQILAVEFSLGIEFEKIKKILILSKDRKFSEEVYINKEDYYYKDIFNKKKHFESFNGAGDNVANIFFYYNEYSYFKDKKEVLLDIIVVDNKDKKSVYNYKFNPLKNLSLKEYPYIVSKIDSDNVYKFKIKNNTLLKGQENFILIQSNIDGDYKKSRININQKNINNEFSVLLGEPLFYASIFLATKINIEHEYYDFEYKIVDMDKSNPFFGEVLSNKHYKYME